MPLEVTAEPVPLTSDKHGVVRVGGTRVTLDTVVVAFNQGSTAEGIVEQYPTLRLSDVYLIIGYYLNHTDEVNAYLESRQKVAHEIRKENERRFDPIGVRERLIARRASG